MRHRQNSKKNVVDQNYPYIVQSKLSYHYRLSVVNQIKERREHLRYHRSFLYTSKSYQDKTKHKRNRSPHRRK